jgi:hypothetical protein
MHTGVRKLLVLLAAAPVAAIGAVAASSQPAEAASCKISISGLPTKVTIDSNDRRYWVHATASGCTKLDRDLSDVYASVRGPGTKDSIDTDFGASDHIELWTSDYKAGKYTVYDAGSDISNTDYNDMHYTWVKKSFTAKYRSYTSLTAKRSGKSVKLSGTVRRYSPDDYAYISHKRPVRVQRYSGGSWHTIKTLTSKGGKYSYTVKTTKHYKYRAKIGTTAATLGSTSGTHSA